LRFYTNVEALIEPQHNDRLDREVKTREQA
jgi:hypothetical protein